MQPPSGGCVLKQARLTRLDEINTAATFGWLCVETMLKLLLLSLLRAATFGWLCVETSSSFKPIMSCGAATFGWLCVET